MTLREILDLEPVRQSEFPVTREKVFLAHAGVCPLPRRVSDAIRDYAALCTSGDQETLAPALRMPQTRELAARLIGAAPEEIAFVGPTSAGLSQVASGLAWKPGDQILFYPDDYPSNVYPWMALAKAGVDLAPIRTSSLGAITPEIVEQHLTPRTRLVALASCHFVSGYRIDISSIGYLLHQRGVLFCLDAIQTLGAFPTPVDHVDFMAADAHKWMLGPCAAGILYVKRSIQDHLRPAAFGWNNVHCPQYIARDTLDFMPDARRYEAGSANLLGIVGLHAALELLLETGIDDIAAELLRKRSWLQGQLQSRGWSVLNADAPPAAAGGILSVHRAGTDLPLLHSRLEADGIAASLRYDRAGQGYLRISPHFYNTDAELERLLERLGPA